ncbi:methyltransferase [Halogeometricum pallidum JCM 14848]|uniref:Methyltransferase n=1 Tax=Halogeometricum pallidum JCM 14848 TaxID=1227487 RepID=M0CSF3_HALPD|nr:class I SAM-dependent methyltransferase [Halogeometricum pallidum]ELZ26141.1 methyltransferase [Halogeometricum pallidum JCM 14848]
MIDRDAVRSNAKYLRNVRPVDPEEICEYIEGTPHPAVVREALRKEAFDLGLVERDDGTFVPVDDDPVPYRDWAPTEFPEAHAFRFEDLLAERHGANWHRGESGDRLREEIRRLKEDYYYQNDVEYDDDAALGYGIYHLPDYYAAVGYVLDDLAENGLLPRTLRVLDVGAGTGGPALGLHEYLPEDSLVEYHAVEPSASADVLERLLDGTRSNFGTRVHRETAEAFDPSSVLPEGEGFDLVLFANVLSELDDAVAVAGRYLDFVAEDGSFVGLAPADLNTSTHLREVERALAPADGGATVYAPTLRLWPGHVPSDRGWSFDVGADVSAPAFQRRLDEAGEATEGRTPGDGTFANETVQFSSTVLRRDGRRRVDVTADGDRYAKMAEMEQHVTNRIDLLAVKLSGDLSAGEGSNPLFKVGDGSEAVEHYAVLTKRDALNEAVARAGYGDVLAFENALCLWNGDEGAYNLVVDAETVVDRVA